MLRKGSHLKVRFKQLAILLSQFSHFLCGITCLPVSLPSHSLRCYSAMPQVHMWMISPAIPQNMTWCCSSPRSLLGSWRNAHRCLTVLPVSKVYPVIQFYKTHPGLAPVSAKSTGTACTWYSVFSNFSCMLQLEVSKSVNKYKAVNIRCLIFCQKYVFTSHKYLRFIHFKSFFRSNI